MPVNMKTKDTAPCASAIKKKEKKRERERKKKGLTLLRAEGS